MSCFPQSEEDGLGVSQWNKPSILQRKNLRIFKEHITAFWNVPTLTQCKYFDINKWTKYWHLKVLLPQRYIYIYIHRIVYKLFTIFPSHKKSSFCLCCDDHKLGMKSYHLKKKKRPVYLIFSPGSSPPSQCGTVLCLGPPRVWCWLEHSGRKEAYTKFAYPLPRKPEESDRKPTV